MRTFKQFLLAENEASPSNVDGSFVVGKVKFDNERGLGATPNNANVLYMGAVGWMTPAAFRRLAHQADRSEDAKRLEDLLRGGNSTGCPFLDLSIERNKEDKIVSIKIKGHEGRARSDAIAKINGANVAMPVHLFFRGGMRAHDLKPEVWDFISTHGVCPEGTDTPIDSGIERVFVQGKSIKL